MPLYFKYSKKNSTTKESFFNGTERVGYTSIRATTEDEIQKALDKGYVRNLLDVTPVKRTKKPVDAPTPIVESEPITEEPPLSDDNENS